MKLLQLKKFIFWTEQIKKGYLKNNLNKILWSIKI